ncbi:hypothetical protein [Herbaspirillum rubrisubalbicans]|uniref:Uncharacterized protein n=1 Tax=Herbaspirillum rubrisubalbicans TaxID=80842 RepID=A0AAD0XFU9_9BURK|nr:hypothetical protein [Herbaspirillum rubrisubalbicans]AYR23014.1 hypothetical protein RC54_03905 [Herbaspirillum rubrisubalbicans]
MAAQDDDLFHGYHLGIQLVGDAIHTKIEYQCNRYRQTVMESLIQTRDRQIREKLIELGWTPPPDKP